MYKLYGEIQEQVIAGGRTDPEVRENIVSVKAEIEYLLDEQVKSSAFRAKVRYMNDGEKATKYFIGLEKRNFTQKTMYAVRKPNGQLTKDYREILNEQERFYRELYTSNPEITFNVQNTSGIKLSDEESGDINHDPTKEEMIHALKLLRKERTPGCDGLTCEFFLKFIDIIQEPLMRMYVYAKRNKMLPMTDRRGIITLIPKANQDETRVSSWRPLTMLNYGYKVLARIMAVRLEKYVDKLIGPQQTAFIQGQGYILEHTKGL